VEFILTFQNTNYAIRAEHCLLEQKLRVGVLPLPAQISAGCGICLRIKPDEINEALKALAEKSISEIELFTRVKENNWNTYTKVQL